MMETPIIDRFWAMPSKNTFSIPPFHALIEQYRRDGISIDPFANAARLASITNDLDPSYDTDYHMDATDFLAMFPAQSVDFVLYDPPFSSRHRFMSSVGLAMVFCSMRISLPLNL